MDLPQNEQPQPAVPQAAAATPFALSPAQATNNILDYSTAVGTKLYKEATKALPREYDVDAQGLNHFLASLTSKAREYGWDDILDIPRIPNDPNSPTASMLTNYGEFTLEQLTQFVQTYINGENRAAQDSMMMYNCIWNTLTKVGCDKIWVWKQDFMVGNLPSGVLLLKVIIREAHIDTNATVQHIREKISSLNEYIATFGHDIDKFNAYVINLTNGLRARGHISSDTLANLFKAYKAVPDKEFVRYIKEKEDAYDEGTNITPEILMRFASDKYKRMVESKEWMAMSKEQEKLIALEAEIKKLTSKQVKAPNQGAVQAKPIGANNKNHPQAKKQGKQQPKPRKPKPEWMLKPPTNNETTTKTVNGKVHHWCSKHKSWGQHTTNECKGLGVKPVGAKNGNSTNPINAQNTTNNDTNRRLTFARAMETIADNEE
jgi:hypothetical protein